MSDTSTDTPIIELAASADGTRNAYSSRCAVSEQVMNYAACLWRQNVLTVPDIKTPADWAPCSAAARNGVCNAMSMRREEEIAGKAIYFVERRRGDNPVVEVARKWVTGAWGSVKAAIRPTPAPALPRATSALDAMGDMGDYSDAITAAVADAPAAAPVAAPKPSAPLPVALPGESPLAMARRLAAAAKAA